MCGYLQCMQSADENLFQQFLVQFWGVATAEYFATKRELASSLYECGQFNNSKLASELALEHMLDLIHLCFRDNLNLRTKIAILYNVLGRLQESYNFTNWWNLSLLIDDYDWRNLRKDLSSLKDENMYEDLDELKLSKESGLDVYLQVLMLKYKLFRESFENLEKKEEQYENFLLGTDFYSGEASPVHVVKGCSPVLNRIKSYVFGNTKSHCCGLICQLEKLVMSIHLQNKYVIPGLLKYETFLTEGTIKIDDSVRTPLTPQLKAYILVDSEVGHWYDTPGAIEHLTGIYLAVHGKERGSEFIEEYSAVCFEN